MKVVIQIPKTTEIKNSYSKEEGLIFEPKFYAKVGSPVLFYVYVQNNNGDDINRYTAKVTVAGELKVIQLNEILPKCDGGSGRVGASSNEPDVEVEEEDEEDIG